MKSSRLLLLCGRPYTAASPPRNALPTRQAMTRSPSYSSTAMTPSIAYDVRGDGDAIIFLHGIGGGRKSWAAQVEALASGFTTVALDLRGYGDSDVDPSEWQFADFVSDVVSV